MGIHILKEWHLVTVRILYIFPDWQLLAPPFVFQEIDEVPEIPRVKKFLSWWQKSLDGKIKRVEWSSSPLSSGNNIRYIN